MSAPRSAERTRRTRETDVRCRLLLDGSGQTRLATGLPFLDHMLDSLARHAGFDLELSCDGDLHIDDHHSVEDCALVLGGCLDEALGDRAGIRRFGHSLVPMDEALARAALDLSGRPWPAIALGLRREKLGAVACENLTHFFTTLAIAGRFCLHLELLAGSNDHHRAEAGFKALAVALRDAVEVRGGPVPSAKGVL